MVIFTLDNTVTERLKFVVMAKAKNNQKGYANEWSKTGTCLNKPQEGWIHSTNELENDDGICYAVRVGTKLETEGAIVDFQSFP